MHCIVRFAACAALALALAGCISEGRFYREGIGTELYTSQLPEVTVLQDQYIDLICRQADLAQGTPNGVLCTLPPVSRNWALFVQAGMNDIDLRCDAFLNWIDYHRRNDRHFAKQIGDTIQATTDILTIASASNRSIELVSIALGLAKNTFANYTARLLTTADQTTIQSIVLTHQLKYRLWLKNEIVDNRPAAIHALRSYLRFCMPATIETEINTATTLVQRGGSAAIAAVEQTPMITPRTIRPAQTVTDIRKPLPPPIPPPPPPVDDVRIGAIERGLSLQTISNLQAALCVAVVDGKLGQPADATSPGSPTRRAIRDYLGARSSKDPKTAPDTLQSRDLTEIQRAIRVVGKCADKGFLGSYEVGLYGLLNATQKEIAVRILQNQLNDWLATKQVQVRAEVNGKLDMRTRDAIAAARKVLNLPELGGLLDYPLLIAITPP